MKEQEKLIEFLSQFTTEERIQTIEKVLSNRTKYVTVALEDIYQSQNASAVLRTCDCFGIQDVHIIENRNNYNINPDVALGSYKWLTLQRYNEQKSNTISAIKSLKSQGYRIVATTPHTNDVSLPNFDLSKGKVALFFGTELTGLSKEMMDNADEFMRIPMYGFTESFNISVSASLSLFHLTSVLQKSELNWRLSKDEYQKLHIKWLKQTIKKPILLIEEFCRKNEINSQPFIDL